MALLTDTDQWRGSTPDIGSELVRSGKVNASHDLWIAATALTHGLGVATRNVSHFERISGLRVVAASA